MHGFNATSTPALLLQGAQPRRGGMDLVSCIMPHVKPASREQNVSLLTRRRLRFLLASFLLVAKQNTWRTKLLLIITISPSRTFIPCLHLFSTVLTFPISPPTSYQPLEPCALRLQHGIWLISIVEAFEL